MAESLDDDARVARAGLLAKRAALGAALVVSLAVSAASMRSIVPAVFGAGVTPLPGGGIRNSTTQICAEGIRRLQAGIASGRPGRRWLDAEIVEATCAQTNEGLDAWAALLRLRRAREQLPIGSVEDLVPLEQDVIAHLPADLR